MSTRPARLIVAIIRSARDDRPGKRARSVFAGCRGFRRGGRRQLGTSDLRTRRSMRTRRRPTRSWRFPRRRAAPTTFQSPAPTAAMRTPPTTARLSTRRRPVRRPPSMTTPPDASSPNQDWGTLDDYQNQQAYGVPYAVYGSTVVVVAGTMNRPWQLSASPFAPMSSPMTQAARPPLNPGLLDESPSMPGVQPPGGQSDDGDDDAAWVVRSASFGFHH